MTPKPTTMPDLDRQPEADPAAGSGEEPVTSPEPTTTAIDHLGYLFRWAQHRDRCGRWTTISGECSCGLNDAIRLALNENDALRARLALAERALEHQDHRYQQPIEAARQLVAEFADDDYLGAAVWMARLDKALKRLDETTP